MTVATTAEMKGFIGRTATITLNDLTFEVEIVDTRVRFGHTDFRIKPVSGTGSVWVEHRRVTFVERGDVDDVFA